MSQTVSITKKNKSRSTHSTLNLKTCLKCGGNGYMKTSPNCYHTCLTCLGKGSVKVQKNKIN